MISRVVWLALFGTIAANALDWKVERPAPGEMLSADSFKVQGVAAPGTVIDARGQAIVVDSTGKFQFKMASPSQEGQFTLKLVARLGDGIDSTLLPVVRQKPVLTRSTALVLGLPESALSSVAIHSLNEADPSLVVSTLPGACSNTACYIGQARDAHADILFVPGAQELGLYSAQTGELIVSSPLESMEKSYTAWAQGIVGAYREAFAESSRNHHVRASELLSGTRIATDTVSGVWTAAAGPYTVYGTPVVPKGKRLVLEAGTIVQFVPGMQSGLRVDGILITAGTSEMPVRFRSAATRQKPGDWDRIGLFGSEASSLRQTEISGAEDGLHIENSQAALQKVVLQGNRHTAIFARNATVRVLESTVSANEGTGILVGPFANVTIEHSELNGNGTAIALRGNANMHLLSSRLGKNGTAIANLQQSRFESWNTNVQDNSVGLFSDDIPDPAIQKDLRANQLPVRRSMPTDTLAYAEPAARVERKPWVPGLAPATMATDSTASRWTWTGSADWNASYHAVKTARVPFGANAENPDSLEPGDPYRNTFVIPGASTALELYLLGRNVDGDEVEIEAALSYNKWDRADANPVTAYYRNRYVELGLGDLRQDGGEIYLSSWTLRGAEAKWVLGQNAMGAPLFSWKIAGGEAQSPLWPGDHNPGAYQDTIVDGTSVAQRLGAVSVISWAPLRRYSMSIGAILSDDRQTDPLLRDGQMAAITTRDPLQSNLGLFAEGDWLFWPGDIQLNGQVAVGRSDTADVMRERAIRHVFLDAGLPTISMATLRRLVADPSRINSLSTTELQDLFGTSALDATTMRDSLVVLCADARSTQDSLETERDDNRVMGLGWGSQDFALRGSARWELGKAVLTGTLRYVGSRYYSPGASGLGQNSRRFDAGWEQKIAKWWTSNVAYKLQVDNAGQGGATNLFGLGEGTRWGLSGRDDSWHEEHLQDPDRARYTQHGTLAQEWKSGERWKIRASYDVEYRTQFRPSVLRPDVSVAGGVWQDSWFSTRAGQDSLAMVNDGDTSYVDLARWTLYDSYGQYDTLAYGLQERVFSQMPSAEVQVGFGKFTLVGGLRWTLQNDLSDFTRDPYYALDHFDFADTTWGKMGYEFSANAYDEQVFPFSLSFADRIGYYRLGCTPRFKNYARNDRKEKEWRFTGKTETPLLDRFLVIGVSGDWRIMESRWHEADGSNPQEKEQDRIAEISVRANHSARLYTEYAVRGEEYLRPDNLQNEYRDLSASVDVHYGF